MSMLPREIGPKIQYAQAHVAPFTTNATAIGTDTTHCTALATKCTAAADALAAQVAAREAMKGATSDLKVALTAMTDAFSYIVKQVHLKAVTAGDSVYGLAQLPVPANPSSRPAPGTPSNLKVSLDNAGGLILKWKCANPPGTQGTIYQVWRRIGENGTIEYLGGTGKKTFPDTTLPAGSSMVIYQIQATRSTKVGPWETFTVLLGKSNGGAMSVSVTNTPSPKMAA